MRCPAASRKYAKSAMSFGRIEMLNRDPNLTRFRFSRLDFRVGGSPGAGDSRSTPNSDRFRAAFFGAIECAVGEAEHFL